jgi:hypothetical protein
MLFSNALLNITKTTAKGGHMENISSAIGCEVNNGFYFLQDGDLFWCPADAKGLPLLERRSWAENPVRETCQHEEPERYSAIEAFKVYAKFLLKSRERLA